MIESMLTTVDNPFDPFDDWDAWQACDLRLGYHTTSFLARMVVGSHELSETDQNLAIESAIDEIIEENITGMYRRVTREVSDIQEET